MALITSNALFPRFVVQLTGRKIRSTFLLIANFAGDLSTFTAVLRSRGELSFVRQFLATHGTSEAGPTSPEKIKFQTTLIHREGCCGLFLLTNSTT